MTFVRTINDIIDGMDGVEHGDSVLDCLNNIIGPETRFEKSDDAVEYLVKQYVEGGDGPAIWDLDIAREGDPTTDNIMFIRNCTIEQFTASFTAAGPTNVLLRDRSFDGTVVYASYVTLSGPEGKQAIALFVANNPADSSKNILYYVDPTRSGNDIVVPRLVATVHMG